jgi:hypothetical protein
MQPLEDVAHPVILEYSQGYSACAVDCSHLNSIGLHWRIAGLNPTKIFGDRFIFGDLSSNSLMYRLKNGNILKSSFQKSIIIFI